MNAQVKPQETIRVLEDVVIEQFNDTNVSLLAKEIEKQLAIIGSKFGITLTVSVGKTTVNTLAARVNGYISTESDGAINPTWKANYMRLCHLLGLTEQDFGRFVHNMNLKNPLKESYEIVGLTPKSLDLIIRTATDKFYRLPLEESKFADDATPTVKPIKAPIDEAVTELIEEPVSDEVIHDVIESVLSTTSHQIDDLSDLEFESAEISDLDYDLNSVDQD